MKKILSVLLAMTIIAGVVGCGGGKTAEAPSSEGAAVEQESASVSTENEYAKIEWMSSSNLSADPEDNFIKDKILEELNVEVMYIDTEDQAAELNLRLIAGDPPDVFDVPNRSYLKEYAEQGYLLNLDDYKEELADAFAFIGDAADSGKIDGVTYAIATRPYGFRDCIYYDANAFRAVGASAEDGTLPKTLDEYIEVIEKCMELDVDGNGVNDTVGFSTYLPFEMGKGGSMGPFFGAYGCTVPNRLVIDPETGAVVDTMISNPHYLECLQKLNEMWKKNIIDHDVFADDEMKCFDKVKINKTVSNGMQWATLKKEGNWNDLLTIDPDAEWEMLPTLTGPYGDSFAGEYASSTYNNLRCISASVAEDPVKLAAVLRFINWTGTEEGLNTVSFGVEGEHWEYDSEGNVKVFDEVVADGTNNFCWVYQFCGRDELPYCRVKFGEMTYPYIVSANEQPYIENITKLIDYPDWYQYVDCQTYIQENVIAMITGEIEPTQANWDKFIGTLESNFQYSEFIEYANESYESMIGK